MTVSFVVLSHSQPESLAELLRELHAYHTYLHVDKSVTDGSFYRKAGIAEHPLIEVNSKPRCLHWGGFSIVQAMMETLNLAIKRSPERVQHFAFLSGQCFPLRPVEEFVHNLMHTNMPVQCRAVSLSTSVNAPWDASIARVNRRHWLDGFVGHTKKVAPTIGSGMRRALSATTWPMKKEVPQINHSLGSQWVSVPRMLGVDLVRAYKNGYFDYLKNAYAPDEMAIPSYVYSTRWADLTQFRGLERMSQAESKVSSYPNFHWLRADMKGNVTLEDVQVALQSKQFFIRKMCLNKNPDAYTWIRESW